MTSMRFPPISAAVADSPVTLPPGRARVAIRPVSTGAPAGAMTIGIVAVAFFAANTAGVNLATITSTLSRTSSSANSRSGREASGVRISSRMFCPST
jgi:hypothetical protein